MARKVKEPRKISKEEIRRNIFFHGPNGTLVPLYSLPPEEIKAVKTRATKAFCTAMLESMGCRDIHFYDKETGEEI